jgi:alkylhydroperoxidase family enzyme
MLSWNDYRSQILARVGEIGKLSPDTVKGYVTLGGAGAKTGHLDAKTRELIALAVAITLRCDGCIAVIRLPRGSSASPRRRSQKLWA